MGWLVAIFGQIRVNAEFLRILTTGTLRYEALDRYRLIVEGNKKGLIISNVVIEPVIDPLCAMSSNNQLLVLLRL